MSGTDRQPRVVEALNRALHESFARWDGLFLLGEDVLDPYGGAFNVTRGLSTAYPDRVLTTPLSESGIVGVANGLAMCGHRVIVEVMFGDFATLTFDQLLNLTSKSVSMYGTHQPMPVVLRCPVGGRRGYGPTHSQSPQKHFIGIPNLALYELSPFHDTPTVLAGLLARDEPSILFEDKVTYTERVYPDAAPDQGYQRRLLGGGNWAHLFDPRRAGRPVVLVIAPGGVGRRALTAATELATDGLDVQVLVPSRLYPVGVADVLDLLAGAEAVWVAEEGTSGGTWGAEVAARLHEDGWHRLSGPVRLISSSDSVIPAAPHLEREMLLGADTIVAAVRAGLVDGRVPVPSPAVAFAAEEPVADADTPLTVPKLNNNDDSYLLVSWLVEDGEQVRAGQPIVEVETSKATEELAAEADGVLRQLVALDAECHPGQVIARLTDPDAPAAGPPAPVAPAERTPAPVDGVDGSVHTLPRAQRQVAEVVAASHRVIPSAFAVTRVVVDELLTEVQKLSEQTGAAIGLAEVLIKAVGELHAEFPLLYGTLRPDGTVLVPGSVQVGVTVDVGTGLFIPVLPDVRPLSVEDVADLVTGVRMRALRGKLAERELTGAAIAVSLNTEDGTVLVQPIIPPGLAAIVSLAAVQEQGWPDGAGGTGIRQTVDIGLAHDHRFVNGRDAAAFLGALKRLLERPGWLTADSE